MSDVIVQFPLIAYGRMFIHTRLGTCIELLYHMLLHDQSMETGREGPISRHGNCYLFPIKGTGRMVYFTIL